ncbi:tail fiber protein [Paenibacillus sp. FSL R7-0652]|uniref:tail fiber protein n=1 Tax=Paenibacillus sp. FSL R7-0652 TaxID=2921687 RepID=UPI00315AB6C1
MPKETDRLKLPLPLGNENVTRESINGIFEKIDAGVATREAILISAGSDLNSYITEGEYYCPENAMVETLANSPTGVAFHLTIEKHAGVVQTLTTFEPSDLQVFQRNYYFGWGSWKKVPTRDEIQQLQEDLQNAAIPPASLTEPGIVQLSNKTDGTSETVAATEKAVNDVRLSAQQYVNDKAWQKYPLTQDNGYSRLSRVDLNTLTDPGMYYADGSQSPNLPTVNGADFYVEVIKISVNNLIQRATLASTSTAIVYVRQRWSTTTWTPWILQTPQRRVWGAL